MFDRKAIKEQGKENVKKNYWPSVLCALIYSLITTASTAGTAANGDGEPTTLTPGVVIAIIVIILASIAIRIFIINPLQIGCCGFFEENVNGKPQVGIIKEGFSNYGHTFAVLFLRDLYLCLWAILFIIPALIKSYSYRMVPFILRDNPQMPANEVIQRSRDMMNGHKWEVFVFDLSYIGWALLGALTFGLVNIFWTEPYRQNANAGIYLKLKES